MVDSQLLPRPPTPPRASSSLNGDVCQSADDSIALAAPTTLPSSSDASPRPLSESRSKRVNFSPMASYFKPPEFTEQSMKSRSRLRSLPPSSNQGVPAKSILKSRTFTSDNLQSDELRSSPPADLSGMLSSVIEQLSGSSHLLRRDAYTQLVASLSAYCDQPDATSILDNMDLFVSWIKRDINAAPSSLVDSDFSLAHQALSLLNMLIFKAETSPRIPDEFKSYILDRATSSIQDVSTPKTIVIDYMRLLSVQNFSPRILTNARVTRLLDTIRGGPDRVGGKAVTALRLNIYDRLFSQARSVFTTHASFWMDNLVAGLLHKVKDVRTKAIQLGFRITDSLGPSTPVFKAIDDVLNLPLEHDAKFVIELCDRLTSMIASRETSQHVPQIWSVVTLLLRSPRWLIEKWDHFKSWMLVIQQCFNCSDFATNSQALLAWNRLVYVAQSTDNSRSQMAKFLFRPIDSQLERKKFSKRGTQTDQAFSSYCNLLYYSFRPGISFERLDSQWAEYITAPSSRVLKWSSGNALGLCRILAMLLWNSHPKVWDEKKAIETTKVSPEDLPRLDCKWVRSRISKVLPVFEKSFDLFTEHDTPIEESPVGLAWIHLSRSLADASSKEIQPSAETMEAIGSILESLQRIWKSTGQKSVSGAKNGDSIFFSQFLFLVKTIVSTLGSVAFTEKVLLKTSLETFSIAQTPTHRRSHPNGVIRSPILHLLQYICRSPYSISIPRYKALLHGIVETGLLGRTSRGSRLDLLRQFAESVLGSTEEGLELSADSVEEVWKSISIFAREALTMSNSDTNAMGKDDTSFRDYDKVMAILEYATKYDISSLEWSSLFQSLVAVVRNQKGDIKASMLIETFVSGLLRNGLAISIGELPLFMQPISFPREPAIEGQSANLPTAVKSRPNTQPFCDKVVTLANDKLTDLYHAQSETSVTDTLGLLDATFQWLERCPVNYHVSLLERMQTGIASWLADTSRKLTAEADIDKSVLTSARALISITIRNLTSLRDTNSEILERLAPLAVAGFESRHRSTVNKFISMWNVSFGVEESLRYPVLLESILRRLSPYVELKLPTFPQRPESKSISPPPEYMSSQESMVTPTPTGKFKPESKNHTPQSAPGSHSRSRKRKLAQKNSTTTPKRPRHDDSQVQFVTVEPSPSSGALESQFMTENQKSVRERQQKDAAIMFPDIHASKASSRRKTLDAPDSDAPTPIILPETANVEEDVQSSPTPASRSPRAPFTDVDLTSFPSTAEWSFSTNEDPPSSPPQTVPSSQAREPTSPALGRTKPNSATKALSAESPARNDGKGPHSTPKPTPKQNPRASRKLKPAKGGDGEGDGENAEIVPDSFSDPLELQIASQLEQDLELSMDLSVSEGKPSKPKNKLGRGRKRKRNGDSAASVKKRLHTPTVEIALTSHVPELPQIAASADLDATSTAGNSSTTQRRSSGRKRPSPCHAEVTGQGAHDDALPAPKKRRSLRLRGQAADDEADAESKDILESAQEAPNAANATPGETQVEAEPERPQTPSRPQPEPREQVSPGSSILQSLKSILGSIRNVSFGRSTLRELDDVMFDIKMEAHTNACKRDE